MTQIPYKDFKGNIAENLADPVRDQDGATKSYVDTAVAGVSLSSVWPVGSIYISVVSTNPGTLLGFGTWEAFGAGRTLVGINGSDADFDTVEETGGAKTITLTGAQSGEKGHNHTQNAHSHVSANTSYLASTGGGYAVPGPVNTNNVNAVNNTTATNIAVEASNATEAHSNLQPYIVTYFWKRTA